MCHLVATKDLAKLYQCKNGTKEINQATRNNEDKFPERYSWVLNDDEYDILRSKNLTANESNSMRRYNPRVFTEQGIAMLATILKTPVATKVSIAIMDAFVAMRHFIIQNKDIYQSLNNINNKLDNQEQKLIIHDKKIEDIFSKFKKEELKEKIYYEGSIYDAYSKLMDIMSEAKKKLIIVDNYADKSVLDMISKIKVDVTLITKKASILSKLDINKYNNQYQNLEVKYSDIFHDRFIVIDNTDVYHLGSSINHAGKRLFAINKLEDKEVINTLIDKINNY